jgi:hypothetical protein
LFEIKRPGVMAKAEGHRTAELEKRLKQKDEVIAGLEEELLAFKKKNPGR